MNTTTTTTTTTTTVDHLVNACVQAAADRITATGSKGSALFAAHGVLDNPGTYNNVHKAASALLESHGGAKASPKHIIGGYKLAKRFATVAEFLECTGLSFANIGEALSEKRTFSINQAESYTRISSEDTAVAAAAKAFQSAKGTVHQRVAVADAASKAAIDEGTAARLQAMRQSMRSELLAEMESQKASTKTKTKAKVTA